MYTMLATLALLPLLVAGALAAPCRDSFSPECSKNGLYNASLKTCACAAPWAGPKCAWITHPGMTCDANTNMCQCASATPVLDMAQEAHELIEVVADILAARLIRAELRVESALRNY